MSELTPYLCVADARKAIDWYARAFGAVVTYDPIVMDDGRIGHTELTIDGARFMLSDEFAELGVASPAPDRGAAVTLHLTVGDVQAVTNRAVPDGARLDRGPEPGPDGQVAVLRDPYGHRWYLNGPA
jgi:PhnB protein